MHPQEILEMLFSSKTDANMEAPMATVRKPAPKTTILLDRLAAAQAEIERLQKIADHLATMPQDEYETGAVVVFEKKFTADSQIYTYAAVKAGGNWYLTGDSYVYDWDSLMDKIYGHLSSGGEVKVWYVSELTPVL